MAALITLLAISLASAAPVTNSPLTDVSANAEPVYVPEPKGRGTFRLMFSCVVTLIICVWTAIHPNIITNPTLGRRLGMKALYVILGLFSPEIILAIAFKEWQMANTMLNDARLAGAAAYAEFELKRSQQKLDVYPAPLSSREVASLTSTLDVAYAAVNTAKEEAAKASILAAEARTTAALEPPNPIAPLTRMESATHTNDDRFLGLNHSEDRKFWSDAHEKQ